jgi:glycosyltransferase involved in cell wall biosynthesis
MKIAYIGQKGIPAKIGGGEKYVEEVAKQMAKKGHEVFVYVRNNYTSKDIKEYEGIKLIHLPSISTKHLDAITHTFLATIHALFQKYDVIHYSMIGPTSLSFIIKYLKPKTIFVSTFQCQDYYHKKWGMLAQKYLKWGEVITCKIPDATIVVSKNLLEYVRKIYKKEAVYIPNGALIKNNCSDSMLKKWNLEKNSYVLTVSRFVRHKGIHYLIEAFKKLEDKNLTNRKKLVVVGDGFHTDDYTKYLKELATGRKNIIFTGPQSGENLNQLFANAYLFVQPSESEGLSLALLEAMGYGKAVLASNITENVEATGETAMTFKSGDSKDLEQKLLSLLNDPQKVKLLGEEAQKRIIENYSWEEIARKIEELYNQITLEKNHE